MRQAVRGAGASRLLMFGPAPGVIGSPCGRVRRVAGAVLCGVRCYSLRGVVACTGRLGPVMFAGVFDKWRELVRSSAGVMPGKGKRPKRLGLGR